MSKNNDPLTFCLLMIVRDEAPVITRALDSVLNMLDSYVICDTGSVDNTMEIIDNYMTEKGIPGYLITKEWKNYGYNKTYLIEQAQKHNLANGAKYLFWLDADEVYLNNDDVPTLDNYPTKNDINNLKMALDLNKETSVFYLMTHYKHVRYPRWNIVRNDQPYYWKYPVHEQLIATIKPGGNIINGMKLLARKEGKNSRDPEHNNKYIDWLLEYIKDDPNDQHCNFYLAQSYQDGGRFQEALNQYIVFTKIPDINTNYNYISCIRIGRIAYILEKYDIMEEYFIKAIECEPLRLEGYFDLIYHFQKINNLEKAIKYVDLDKCSIVPQLTYLFVEQDIYDWKYALQASYVAYLAKDYTTAVIIGKYLINSDRCPEHIKIGAAKTNLAEYERVLSIHTNPLLSKFPTNLIEKHMFTIVIDNFFPEPNEIRNYAIEQSYSESKSVGFANKAYKILFEQLIGRIIVDWNEDDSNGYFKYTTVIDESPIETINYEYTAVIFLTDTKGDTNISGLDILSHKKTGIIDRNNFEKLDENIKSFINKDIGKRNEWNIDEHIVYKYNRCVLFNSQKFHSYGNGWGINKETSKLMLFFHFN